MGARTCWPRLFKLNVFHVKHLATATSNAMLDALSSARDSSAMA
jgi:hypothetical protein